MVKSCRSGCVLVEKGAERWKVAQCCCLCSPWLLGSSSGMEVAARSGGFICCGVLVGLSSAQPHPNTLLPSSPRGPGLSDCCQLRVLNHLQMGNEGFFLVASSSQGCAEHVALGQSSCLVGAGPVGAISRTTWVSLSCWGYRWVQFRGELWLWLLWCTPLVGGAGDGAGTAAGAP